MVALHLCGCELHSPCAGKHSSCAAELQKGKGGTQAAADPNMSYNGLAGGNNHAAPVDAHSEAHDVAVKV